MSGPWFEGRPAPPEESWGRPKPCRPAGCQRNRATKVQTRWGALTTGRGRFRSNCPTGISRGLLRHLDGQVRDLLTRPERDLEPVGDSNVYGLAADVGRRFTVFRVDLLERAVFRELAVDHLGRLLLSLAAYLPEPVARGVCHGDGDDP